MSDRDSIGYGANPPYAGWPGWARVAVSVVVHFDGGAGDDYGARAGFWRLHRVLTQRGMPVTVFASARALDRHPDALQAMLAAGWEIGGRSDGVASVADAMEAYVRFTGERPLGWYADAVADEGEILYHAGSYADDLPFYDRRHGRAQLVVPCCRDTDDVNMIAAGDVTDSERVFRTLHHTFEQLRAEGGRMMSVGLHGAVTGRPAHAFALARFLDHALASGEAWITRRVDIARHWLDRHPA